MLKLFAMIMFLNYVCAKITVRDISDKLERGKILSGDILYEQQPVSITGCIKECLSTRSCEVISYHLINKKCVLGSNESSTVETHDNLYRIGVRRMLNDTVNLGHCSHHSCPPDKKCIPLKSRQIVCLKIFCSKVGNKEMVQPHQRIIGSSLSCINESTSHKSVCQANGLWKPKLECCSKGFTWNKEANICYMKQGAQANYQNAKKICNDRGVTIIKFTSKSLMNIFVSSTKLHFDYWVDGTDEQQEGIWRFNNGSEFKNVATMFHNDEPNGDRSENCLLKHYSGLFDVPCNIEHFVVCQSQLVFP